MKKISLIMIEDLMLIENEKYDSEREKIDLNFDRLTSLRVNNDVNDIVNINKILYKLERSRRTVI